MFVGIVHDRARQKPINPKTRKGRRIFSSTDRKSDRTREPPFFTQDLRTESKIKSVCTRARRRENSIADAPPRQQQNIIIRPEQVSFGFIYFSFAERTKSHARATTDCVFVSSVCMYAQIYIFINNIRKGAAHRCAALQNRRA